jgi:hypothetical protein
MQLEILTFDKQATSCLIMRDNDCLQKRAMCITTDVALEQNRRSKTRISMATCRYSP